MKDLITVQEIGNGFLVYWKDPRPVSRDEIEDETSRNDLTCEGWGGPWTRKPQTYFCKSPNQVAGAINKLLTQHTTSVFTVEGDEDNV